MKLTQEEAAHFFKLMWPVQFFVNRKLNLLPEIQDLESYIRCTTEEKMRVREALYENIHLLKDFTEENPQNLTEKELGIVAGWKHFRKGDFYMERFLKTYAVFIDDKNKVYGVLGLTKQPPAKAGGFVLRTESPDTRRLNDASNRAPSGNCRRG
jgi:hypothetical protein